MTYGAKASQRGKFAKLFRKVNWYWDVRLYLPLFLVLILAAGIPNQKRIAEARLEAAMAAEPVVIETVAAIVEETEETTPSPEEVDITALARLADSVGGHRSDEVKRVIMWVLINRTEDTRNGYGGSLLWEIARPNQWQGYDEDAGYLESTYNLAKEVYETWKTGGARPIYSDMLWFVLNKDGSITVRNQYKETKNRAEMTFGQ